MFPKRLQFSFILLGFCSLKGGGGAHSHSQLGLNHTKICPAFCTSHGMSDKNILDVITPHNDKINHVLVFRVRVHPQGLILCLLLEDGIGYGKVMFRAKSQYSHAICIHPTNAMPA